MTAQQDISIEDLMAALKWNPERHRERVPAQYEFPYGNKVALIAPPSAGKTVTVAGLFMRAQAKVKESKDTDMPFYARVLEGGSNIRQDISNLTQGLFPAKTRSYLGFRSSPGLLLEQKKFAAVNIPLTDKIFNRAIRPRKELWHKMLQLPICDLPGETLTQVIVRVRAQTLKQQKNYQDIIERAIMEMRESDAYIFIVKASEAMGLGTQIDVTKDKTISTDPDVPLTRMADDIFNYKMRHGKQVKKAFIAITAWDKLAPKAEGLGIDLLSPNVGRQHMEEFVANCYPQFYAALHSNLRSQDISYYALFFETVKKNGVEVEFEDTVPYKDPQTGEFGVKTVKRPHIKIIDIADPRNPTIWEGVRKVHYSKAGYDRLLNDVMTLARTR